MKLLLATAFALVVSTGLAQAEGDAAKGEIVFKKCMACHAIGPGAKTKVGPPLNGIVGNKWAHFAGYPYSEDIKEGAAAGKVWDVATLDNYLTNPKVLAPKGKMSFPGLKSEEDRANLIAYLMLFDAEGNKK